MKESYGTADERLLHPGIERLKYSLLGQKNDLDENLESFS